MSPTSTSTVNFSSRRKRCHLHAIAWPDLLWAVLTSAYARLGFDVLGDDGFRAMVLARIVEPTSKAECDSVQRRALPHPSPWPAHG
jgi:hypothetical protein